MPRFISFISLIFLLPMLMPPQLQAQSALTMFTDCNCNQALIKQRIAYVNHTTDRANAQVFLFITTQRLPQGGVIYKLDFTGQGELAENHLQFELPISPLFTEAERDTKLVDRIEIGLMGFIAGTGYAELVKLKIDEQKAAEAAAAQEAEEEVDIWDSRIFEAFSSASFNRESLRKTSDFRAGLRIERATPELRIRYNPFYSYWSQQFTTSDGEVINSFRKRMFLSTSVVKSISDHWSLGFFGFGQHHSFRNIDLGLWFAPAIEYSFFNYDEVPFKEFTFAYRFGLVYNDYLEETVFLETEELLFQHNLNLDLRLRQKWGNAFAGISARAYQNDFSKNSLRMNGRFDVRVFKGLSVNFGGSYEIINDQINLPRGDASLEDILLGQTQLATNFETDFRFGLSYTFGATYNNVVNTRL